MNQQLPDILQPHSDLLETLAKVWLQMGAAHVAIWGEGQVFANWSNKPTEVSNSQPTYSQISTAIRLDDEVIGHLYVFGQNDRISKKRLKLDADLISSKIKLTSIKNNDGASAKKEVDQVESKELEKQIRKHQVEIKEIERSLHQVQKQFDALIKLNQYPYQENGDSDDSIDDWLIFFRKIVLDLIPSQLVFTLDDQGKGALVPASHPVRFKDAEKMVHYLQKTELLGAECLLNKTSDLGEVPESVRGLLYSPIYSGKGHTVSIGLINREDSQFSEGDQALLRMITTQAQGQVDRLLSQVELTEGNRLRTEMEVAFEVQNHLLPEHAPHIEGLDIYAYSRSALHVGGDFYDFHIREDQSFIFTVGDVSGKGMSSALMMGSTRQILNSKARNESIKAPKDLLSSASHDLYEDFMRVQMFATVFAGFYDPVTQQLTYANAGHSPIIYCAANGSARLLDADSPPIGVLNTCLALNHKLQMYPGDCLMVATDGLSEAQNKLEEQFGTDRLLNALVKLAKENAEDTAKMLFKDIDNFSLDSSQTDDQTLVIFKVK
ncbi:MAG: serine phosphatase RsbU (regulator of sigma subunit) [Candidatus Promineifilaceae bacterium]|jgi:serine phosphatase RsbU (regulator of sigma subunit)